MKKPNLTLEAPKFRCLYILNLLANWLSILTAFYFSWDRQTLMIQNNTHHYNFNLVDSLIFNLKKKNCALLLWFTFMCFNHYPFCTRNRVFKQKLINAFKGRREIVKSERNSVYVFPIDLNLLQFFHFV